MSNIGVLTAEGPERPFVFPFNTRGIWMKTEPRHAEPQVSANLSFARFDTVDKKLTGNKHKRKDSHIRY